MSELKRVNDVYDSYPKEKDLSYRWSILNEGNQYIENEIITLITSLFKTHKIKIRNKKILDVGCAGGDTVRLLKNLGGLEENISGIDIRKSRLNQTRKLYPKANIVYMDARNLKFKNNEFDLICIFTVLTSIPNPLNRQKISNEITRVLKPGGVILYYDLRYNNPFNKNIKAIRRKEIDGLFPNMIKSIHSITLIPPIARRLGILTKFLYPFLSRQKTFRSHYGGIITKEDIY